MTTTTTIHPDGSFTRKVVYTVAQINQMMGFTDQKAQKEKPEDFFKIPSASNAKIERSQDSKGETITTVRELAAGSSPLTDITLWAQKGKAMATSTVTVTNLGDGKIQYLETLHATSPGKSARKLLIAELRAKVKGALPEKDRQTELIDKLTEQVTLNLIHALLGPPEANLFGGLIDPDATARRINISAFGANVRTIKSLVPGVTDSQSMTIARALINTINKDVMSGSGDDSLGESKSDAGAQNELSPMSFSVSFPGKLIDTNGLYDPSTGEVYWSLLPMALELGDVQLRLVSQR